MRWFIYFLHFFNNFNALFIIHWRMRGDKRKGKESIWVLCMIRKLKWCYQNPSLLLNLDLSTYSWICSLLTGSSTASLTLKEAYLDGSKSLGMVWSAPLACLHCSTSWSCISLIVPLGSYQPRWRWQYVQRKGWRWCWYCCVMTFLPVLGDTVLEWHCYDMIVNTSWGSIYQR